MNTYTIYFSQTEYRKITVQATDPTEAVTKYLHGDGVDEFVTTSDDQRVLAIDLDLRVAAGDEVRADDTVLCLFDSSSEFAKMTDPATAEAIYATLRDRNACESIGV